ncbi:hypothetical protein Efla_004507 [Eimeria flavescens]
MGESGRTVRLSNHILWRDDPAHLFVLCILCVFSAFSALHSCFPSTTKTERAIRQAVRAVLTEHASKRRGAQKGVLPRASAAQQASRQESAQAEEQPQVMGRFHTSPGTDDAESFSETSTEVPGAEHAVLPPTTEDPPPGQRRGRPLAILGDRGQPAVTSTPIRLLSTKHQPPAENVEEAQQGGIVGQSEGTCEPSLAAAPTPNSNEAIFTTPHVTALPSITQQGANRQVPLDRDTLATNTDATRTNTRVQQQRADANTFALQLHQLPGVQLLSPATKNEPKLVHWEAFFISFEAAAAPWQALPKCR